jgi:hypothetical protein
METLNEILKLTHVFGGTIGKIVLFGIIMIVIPLKIFDEIFPPSRIEKYPVLFPLIVIGFLTWILIILSLFFDLGAFFHYQKYLILGV